MEGFSALSTSPLPDYYELLGVSRTASAAAIKKAYHEAVRRYHPDVNSAPNAETFTRMINEAHAVLSDPLLRREYDARSQPTHGYSAGTRPPPDPPGPARPPPRQGRAAPPGGGSSPQAGSQARPGIPWFFWVGAVVVLGFLKLATNFGSDGSVSPNLPIATPTFLPVPASAADGGGSTPAALRPSAVAVTPTPGSRIAQKDHIKVVVTYQPPVEFPTWVMKVTGLQVYRNGELVKTAAPPSGKIDSTTEDGLHIDIVDFDADGEPEISIRTFSGGVHCCFSIVVYSYSRQTNRYVSSSSASFGSSPIHIRPATDGKGFIIVGADPAFEYAFTSFSDSGVPIRICRFDSGQLVNATAAYPQMVRGNASMWWEAAKKTKHGYPGSTAAGDLAAYAADKYVLGEGNDALSTIESSALPGVDATYVENLRAFLEKNHYASADPSNC